jgi:hypothetical protein
MDKIIGDIAGVPNPKSDWSQNDERKADFIKNKPIIPDVLESEELTYHQQVEYTTNAVYADGMISRLGKVCTLYIYKAQTINGWQDIFYRLPFEPDSKFLPIVNSMGVYESNGVHYKVAIDHIAPSGVTYPVLRLNHYVNGNRTNWEANQNVSFRLDYIIDENDL